MIKIKARSIPTGPLYISGGVDGMYEVALTRAILALMFERQSKFNRLINDKSYI